MSDDLEMGGVLSAAPIGEAAVEFVRAGGDLCLVCHREDFVLQAYEALIKNGGTRLEIRAAGGGVGAACAGIQEEMRERICGLAKAPSRSDGREADSPVVGVRRAGAAGAFRTPSG